jgi:hypothetical protein
MSVDLVSRVGRALYGEGWRAALARELGISDRSFRVWASGRSAVPVGILEELLELLEIRDTELAALQAELTVCISNQDDAAG